MVGYSVLAGLGLATSVTLAVTNGTGYVLPSSGTASTTQFLIGPELSGGTACGVGALPNGASSLPNGQLGAGGGPGYLYVRNNAAVKKFCIVTNEPDRRRSTSWHSAPTLPSRVPAVPEVLAASAIS